MQNQLNSEPEKALDRIIAQLKAMTQRTSKPKKPRVMSEEEHRRRSEAAKRMHRRRRRRREAYRKRKHSGTT